MKKSNLEKIGSCGICNKELFKTRGSGPRLPNGVITCSTKCGKLLWEESCAIEKTEYAQSCTECGEILQVKVENSSWKVLRLIFIILLCIVALWFIIPTIVGMVMKVYLFMVYADPTLSVRNIVDYRFRLHSSDISLSLLPEALQTFHAMAHPHYKYDSIGINIFTPDHRKLGWYYTIGLIAFSVLFSIFALIAYPIIRIFMWACPCLINPCRRKMRRVTIQRMK